MIRIIKKALLFLIAGSFTLVIAACYGPPVRPMGEKERMLYLLLLLATPPEPPPQEENAKADMVHTEFSGSKNNNR